MASRCAGAALALGAAICTCMPAYAENGQVDQVERLDAEPGETEIENQLILVRRADPHGELLKTTFEHAVSERMQLGIEFSSQRVQGTGLELTTIGLQATWTLLDPEEAPVGLGIQPSLEIDSTSGALGSETFFIAEVREGPFDIAANAILSTEPGAWDDVGLFWALRADRDLGGRVLLGLEAGGSLIGEGAGSHFAGPVLVVGLGEDGPALELGLFAPLTDRAPGFQLRFETDWEF
ncbi:hypothetical protein [Novosphingobium mangrovi (ex Hu et al. 2023)]|uniref:Transporter n=1 Tax=Novosphingobium mangrovi (ex Hu et al. 2023) TaxID=2930094 RepID=A0ABT0AG41_9SPHN|nr:hypothetical protein [Novosphingobium mangrovi (ex Hu et al. 2023)]MCJ1962157.1 hypothetical protein [Novosphingobium mangrovi (ex Hu et al. 2023)]